ncbi:uncharacterized protein L969DRAFT_103356 [Mixia osmundae IAM 14324]|uniref:Uncharacterized protein n=1 Tax=Mixia osmundae (strain CBS 9802 / IAM 14324 / JCM 22182 / KY 12970) TaxID=764103 RepID=G7E3P2_MIXOS|nr:uncharacterized protein L969DRAFT_103356 [Mixia osmundae IAM 14324]KEI39435.1 hypothetical protein L969DRAFT_103356 [Mixia osmundae IAM 14324]GAA97452.1 hypothetical protein E5Q_04131 [Mixia osmundae IAM 14324]
MNPDNSTDAQSQSAHREGLKLLTAHPLSPYPSLLLSPVSPVDRPASAPPSRSSVMSAYDDFVKQLATGEHPTCSTQELLSLAPVATQFPLAQKIEQTVQARHAGTKTKLRSALTGKSGQELEEMILQAYKCILMRTSEIEALASIANASLRDLGALRARLEAATQLQPIENDRPAPANLGHASSSSPTHGMSQGASVTRIAQSKRPASPDGPYKEAAQTQTRQHATQIVRPISGNSMPPIFISRSAP